MNLEIGIKSDPILHRFSYEWLFELMQREGVFNLQLGSFFEMYRLPDEFFLRLRDTADTYGVRIRSCFTAHRELGSFFASDPALPPVAFDAYRRLIEIGSLLGAESVGSNPGAVLRDKPDSRTDGEERYLTYMVELAHYAAEHGLAALTIEPMSSLFEPPSTPTEIERYMRHFVHAREGYEDVMAPVYLCPDVSHGVADRDGVSIHGNLELFECALPWMWEFHLKNTDERYDATFGFGREDRERGIVDLPAVRAIIENRARALPRRNVVGYLEISGPKVGRDYSDYRLEEQLAESLDAIKRVFHGPPTGE